MQQRACGHQMFSDLRVSLYGPYQLEIRRKLLHDLTFVDICLHLRGLGIHAVQHHGVRCSWTRYTVLTADIFTLYNEIIRQDSSVESGLGLIQMTREMHAQNCFLPHTEAYLLLHLPLEKNVDAPRGATKFIVSA